MTFGDGSKRTIIAGAFSVALGLVALTGCGASTSSGGYTLTDGKVEFEGKTLTVTLDCDGSYEWEESATGDGLTYDGVQHDEEQNADGLNYLAGEAMYRVNKKAMLGTLLAHEQGGTETLLIRYGAKDARTLGELLYFLELACAASGYLLGVNPFNQPGVEAYKKNMFALLGKPGYEEQRASLEEQLKTVQ